MAKTPVVETKEKASPPTGGEEAQAILTWMAEHIVSYSSGPGQRVGLEFNPSRPSKETYKDAFLPTLKDWMRGRI